MSESKRQPRASAHDPAQDARVRAERVRAMLARWAHEDVADEPDWNADAIAPVGLRPAGNTRTRR